MVYAPFLFALEERGYVVWVFVPLFILMVVYVLAVGIRNANKRAVELRECASEIKAEYFKESSATKFPQQLLSLRFPFFNGRYGSRVSNIFQVDIAEGRIFHFDYWNPRNGDRGDAFGSVVLLINRRDRCAEPVVVSNCLIEKCFRRFWHVDYPELRAALRLKLKQKPTCHVEVSNDGLLYFSNRTEADMVEDKMQFACELFSFVECRLAAPNQPSK